MADSLGTGQKPASVSVIIPVLDDDAGHAQTLEPVREALASSGLTCEVIITATAPLAAAVPDAAGLPAVRFVPREHGSGWGDAVLAASAEAQHDLVCTIDLPALNTASEIPRLVRALEENDAAMAVGVRIGIQQPIPARRRIVPWIIDMVASDALGRPLPDVNSGFRVLRRPALADFAGQFSARPSLPAALTLLMLAANAPILFVPLDDDRGPRRSRHGKLREAFQLIRLIIAFGLEFSPRRTLSLIGRMALMMLMMAAMMLMMMWMMGALPEF